MFALRLDKAFVSTKVTTKSREKSAFIAEILANDWKKFPFQYVSHKAWLESLGEKATTMSAGSLNNGPRYSLKRYGIVCQAITLSGKDLDAISEHEGRELSESSIIYAISKAPEVK